MTRRGGCPPLSLARNPCSGGPRARRSFTPGQKLELLAGYEQAVAVGEGGAFLRREGLHSSLLSEWRRARDAGLLQGKPAGETVGRPSAEQAEIARLRRELQQAQVRLARCTCRKYVRAGQRAFRHTSTILVGRVRVCPLPSPSVTTR